jgi:O-antigen ligase
LKLVHRLAYLHATVVLIVAVIYGFIFRGNGVPWMWIAVWVVGFGLTALTAIRPELGLAAYAVTVYSTPRYDRLFNILFASHLLHLLMFFAVSGTALWLARNGRRPRLDSPVLLLALALIGWGCISALLATPEAFQAVPSAQNPRHSPAFFFHALLLLGIASQVMGERASSRWFTLPIAIGLTVRILSEGRSGLRLESDIGPLLVMMLPVCVLLIQLDSIRSIRVSMALAALGAIVTIALTYNRASAVALSVVFLLVCWRYRRNTWIIGATVVCIAAAVLWVNSSPYRTRFQQAWHELRGSAVGSVSERLELWAAGFAIAINHPVIGVGPGHYSSELSGYAPKLEGSLAHNNYVQMAAETGFVGLGLYLALFGTALWATWRTAHHVPQGWRGATAGAIQISIVAYLTVGFFITRHDMVLAYVFVGWGAALTSPYAYQRRRAAGAVSESRRDSLGSGRP